MSELPGGHQVLEERPRRPWSRLPCVCVCVLLLLADVFWGKAALCRHTSATAQSLDPFATGSVFRVSRAVFRCILWVFRVSRFLKEINNSFSFQYLQDTRNTHKLQRNTARDTRNTLSSPPPATDMHGGRSCATEAALPLFKACADRSVASVGAATTYSDECAQPSHTFHPTGVLCPQAMPRPRWSAPARWHATRVPCMASA